jgi:hypothetical protein
VDSAVEKAAKLGEGVRLVLVDEATPQLIEDVLITAGDGRDDLAGRPHSLQIILSPAAATRLDRDTLVLASVSGATQVGAAQLAKVIDSWTLIGQEIHALPRRILPDPTIAGSVEFVLSEARYAQKRKSAARLRQASSGAS